MKFSSRRISPKNSSSVLFSSVLMKHLFGHSDNELAGGGMFKLLAPSGGVSSCPALMISNFPVADGISNFGLIILSIISRS
ncbi:hypothetical protein D3C86_1974840 [compost metagenome]